MNAIVFEHVNVDELPEKWRNKLAKSAETHVTVRIEYEVSGEAASSQSVPPSKDPAFGIWRDRQDMTDVEAHMRTLRAPRYGQSGTRTEG
jgi:hypothetical protein